MSLTPSPLRYTFAEQTFLSSRQMPRKGSEGLRPWQPVIACDPSAHDPTAEGDGRNRVSCRWYNEKHAWTNAA